MSVQRQLLLPARVPGRSAGVAGDGAAAAAEQRGGRARPHQPDPAVGLPRGARPAAGGRRRRRLRLAPLPHPLVELVRLGVGPVRLRTLHLAAAAVIERLGVINRRVPFVCKKHVNHIT